MTRRRALGLALCLTSAVAVGLVGGCGLPTGELVVYDRDAPELEAASLGPDGSWESAPWSAPNAPWFAYPPRATVQIEHTLGYAPRTVLVYLSFEATGGEPGMAALDLARVVSVDESTITIRNDTSAMYFARVVAR